MWEFLPEFVIQLFLQVLWTDIVDDRGHVGRECQQRSVFARYKFRVI